MGEVLAFHVTQCMRFNGMYLNARTELISFPGFVVCVQKLHCERGVGWEYVYGPY